MNGFFRVRQFIPPPFPYYVGLNPCFSEPIREITGSYSVNFTQSAGIQFSFIFLRSERWVFIPLYCDCESVSFKPKNTLWNNVFIIFLHSSSGPQRANGLAMQPALQWPRLYTRLWSDDSCPPPSNSTQLPVSLHSPVHKGSTTLKSIKKWPQSSIDKDDDSFYLPYFFLEHTVMRCYVWHSMCLTHDECLKAFLAQRNVILFRNI